MYSPKITDSSLIERLYKLGKDRRKKMTVLVKEAVTEYLDRQECLDNRQELSSDQKDSTKTSN